MASGVPNPVVKRLSVYLRHLELLEAQGAVKVSSRQLSSALLITPEQVRKDLGHFGQLGRRGVGYLVTPLAASLRHILGTDKTQKVVVVGAGDLGRALLRHRGFELKGFEIVAAFDIDPSKIGQMIGSVPVYHAAEIQNIVNHYDIHLAVVAVPAGAAQEVADVLCRAGVRGILNFAPVTLKTPKEVAIIPVDLAASLEELSFQVGGEFLRRNGP